MTLGIVIEQRRAAGGAWQPVTIDRLLAHRQFRRLELASAATECPVYTLAAPSAMVELLRGGFGAEATCAPLQEGAGLPGDVSAACRRDVEAFADPGRGPAGWFTSARLNGYDWEAGRRELQADDSWVQDAFGIELREEADHLAATLSALGDPEDVRVVLFLV